MNLIDARVVTKKGALTIYQPQLKLGWWIFKSWTSFCANKHNDYLNLNNYPGGWQTYDEAMDQLETYKKMTGNGYHMTHPMPLGSRTKKK